ncbi:hypothetical protein CAPTEDRAFT_211924 [Capitella teleta]|uniref:Endonuclease/exonuclease/phosphatase domain-containing protein n=1 Tax=Capitella teleta TaxID=283909 RepID=R7UDM6_CAPTE|nr:hypothetical protein CAPTEDRAFT_211924 [Capitella teleta]|eukprot:ELU04475.1 hypothetical protein CAPTEDRAFT_211924 [Capitella teleta]
MVNIKERCYDSKCRMYVERGCSTSELSRRNCCDIPLIQEHWFLCDDIVKLAHNEDVLVTGISGMDATQLQMGRPFGGCALIYKRNWNCSGATLKAKCGRLCACIISLPSNVRILVFNVYMPCDALYDDASLQIFIDVINEIESMIELHNDIDVVVVGCDLNTDVNRANSLHVQPIHDFCDRQSLQLCVNSPVSQVDFTYEIDFSGANSHIDHFLVSENVFNGIQQYVVCCDGDNLSVLFKLSIDTQYSVNNTGESFVSKPSWQQAKSADLQRYKDCLREQSHALVILVDALVCNEFECEVHCEALQTYYSQIIDSVIYCADRTIPMSKKEAKAG